MKKTNYLTLDNLTKSKPVIETKFTHCIGSDKDIIENDNERPSKWDNILHIGTDKYYGDVFKCWDNGNENNFTIYFGVKGDEFE